MAKKCKFDYELSRADRTKIRTLFEELSRSNTTHLARFVTSVYFITYLAARDGNEIVTKINAFRIAKSVAPSFVSMFGS